MCMFYPNFWPTLTQGKFKDLTLYRIVEKLKCMELFLLQEKHCSRSK